MDGSVYVTRNANGESWKNTKDTLMFLWFLVIDFIIAVQVAS